MFGPSYVNVSSGQSTPNRVPNNQNNNQVKPGNQNQNVFRAEDYPSSPLYYPNENPSLVLTSSPLTTNNYHSWSRNTKMALLSKNKLKFVENIHFTFIGKGATPWSCRGY